MSIKIALTGNANCGKTTMFNHLTGASQYVGNWPGVTVEKKEGRLKGHKDVIITDLPGIYSLSPYSPEEIVTRDYIFKEDPDAIINIVDASNIERNLYLTTQILESGKPTVIALNMMDLSRKKGDQINTKALSELLGCVVVETSALKNEGMQEVASEAVKVVNEGSYVPKTVKYSPRLEEALEKIISIISGKVAEIHNRYYAIKLFERDERVSYEITLSDSEKREIEKIISETEKDFLDDSESIIANERYVFAVNAVKECVKKGEIGKTTTSDKIDALVTNRLLALPIFVAVMWTVYYISVSWLGAIGTDWANDGVFGDGWFLFGIGRESYDEAVENYGSYQSTAQSFLTAADEAGIDISKFIETKTNDDGKEEITAYLGKASVKGVDYASFFKEAEEKNITGTNDTFDEDGNAVTEKIDLAAFDKAYSVYELEGEPDPAEFGPWLSGIPPIMEGMLDSAGCADWLKALILDGIIGGVGSVLGFLPQIVILFFLLSILEDCGYMTRIAFILDSIFRKFGLSGKSFIPMLIGTGCGVPGVMASRTIENEADRKITIMTTTFMPCSAKLPIIALIAGAMFPGQNWVAPSAYLIGILAIMFSGLLLKHTKSLASEPTPFVMELPPYHIPSPKSIFMHTWDRAKSFVAKAGTIILVACAFIWFVSSFNWSFEMVDTNKSILASIGNIIAPVFSPLGWGNWKASVAAITGLVAKENVVGTFGILYGGYAEVAEDGLEVWNALRSDPGYAFTPVTAYSFLVFNLLCAPCFAAIGAIRREMGNAKWTFAAIGYQTVLAYIVSLLVTLYGTALFEGQTANLIYAIIITIAVALLIAWIFISDKKRQGNLKKFTNVNL